LALVFNTASSKQLDAKFAAATLCGLDLLAICSNADKRVKRAQKNAPSVGRPRKIRNPGEGGTWS
jgi:hypothetical protein